MFLGIVLSGYLVNRELTPGRLHEKFQKAIFELEGELGRISAANIQNFKSGRISSPYEKIEAANTGKNRGVSFLVFRGDSLAWWNSNRETFTGWMVQNLSDGFHIVKLKNGWYGVVKSRDGPYIFLTCRLIRNGYAVQNRYLINHFAPGFELPDHVSLTGTTTPFPVISTNGTFLCALVFGEKSGNREPAMITGHYDDLCYESFILIAFLAAIVFMTWFFNELSSLVPLLKRKNLLRLFIVIVAAAGSHWLLFYLKFPAAVYLDGNFLFTPCWYSSSFLLPSLGDFLVNSVLLLMFAVFAVKPGADGHPDGVTGKWKAVRYFIPALLIPGLFAAGFELISGLVINSSFPLNLQNISEFIPASLIGLSIVTILCITLALVSEKLVTAMFSIYKELKWLIPAIIFSIIVYFAGFTIAGAVPPVLILLFFAVYLVFRWLLNSGYIRSVRPVTVLFLCFFYAVFVMFILNDANRQKERGRLNLMAIRLSTGRNPVTEDRYDQVEELLRNDRVLQAVFQSGNRDIIPADSLENYLKTNYFNEYWRRYNLQITCCQPGKELKVQPQGYAVGCSKYFRDMINASGQPTSNPGLFYLDFGYGKEYYLAALTGNVSDADTTTGTTIFLEFTSINTISDPGYPGLLINQNNNEYSDLADYSYALYQDGQLAHSAGNMVYPLNSEAFGKHSAGETVFVEGDHRHFYFRTDRKSELLISRNRIGFLSYITPFSYFFILFILISVALAFGKMVSGGAARFSLIDLRTKLQVSFIGILFLTILIIGVVQVFYIIGINAKKNRDYQREKAFSVLTDVQHRYGIAESDGDLREMDVESFLMKLSNVFFTEINLYDPAGKIISSSRMEIFSEGLVSGRMDPSAMKEMISGRNSLLIHDEQIGTMKFGSVYVPLHNDQGKLLGFINLPYFSRQDELKKEISAFLVTFSNIYILLLILGILIIFLISNYITQPLALLSEKLTLLRLGKTNEKISWQNKDEIGRLVDAYNRMVDEIGRSALQLAKTEREGAWREMARQVAHEIKNPLTPMKLGTQYLQKSWNEHAPDMDTRIEKFTKTLVEQIDTLAKIASDFSDFAKMPAPAPVWINFTGLLRDVLGLYPDSGGITYRLESEIDQVAVYADRSQITRVLTNLINNAVQAIGDRPGGLVRIGLKRSGDHVVLEISDNGSGIPPERAARIFMPDFTTKSGGMGLGLAIVRGIITEMKGEINFTSEENSGTTFTVILNANFNLQV